MKAKVVHKSAYSYTRANGKVVHVPAHEAHYASDPNKPLHLEKRCPKCGQKIRGTRMPKGGFVWESVIDGIRGVKHPCFNLGSHLSKKRDEDTRDLLIEGGLEPTPETHEADDPPAWRDHHR